MENLNAEQIKKTLECCSNPTGDCPDFCPLRCSTECVQDLAENALALITSQEQRIEELAEEVADWKAIAEGYQKQFEDCAEDRARLTEENESIKQCLEHEHASFMETFGEYADACDMLTAENERLRAEILKEISLRFATHFGTYTNDTEVKVTEVFQLLKQIEKEILEGDQ